MTIADLRSLQAIIADAIDDIERVYASHGSQPTEESRRTPDKPQNYTQEVVERTLKIHEHKKSLSNSQAYVSPPPSPSIATYSQPLPDATTDLPSRPIDFPSLNEPCVPSSPSETLTTHPVVIGAIGRIVAAAGQLSVTVQIPFLTICDASMGYHLPSCMRLLEASHVVEILREAGSTGLHVNEISKKNGVKATKLAHILRLLATHHILREVSPDVFTLNRISSLIDSGMTFAELQQFQAEGRPEFKYRDTNGIAAFVGLCSDEIQKSSAYMTETYYLSPSQETRDGKDPDRAPFCFAFDTVMSRTGFFGWLEGQASSNSKPSELSEDEGVETGRGAIYTPTLGEHHDQKESSIPRRPSSIPLRKAGSPTSSDSETSTVKMNDGNSNRFRLERFGKAMTGTDGWEVPGAVLNGFDWHSLPRGSTIVDVGGGIGSTSMLLATAFSSSDDDGLDLKFIIQDRSVVCEMGEKAWKVKCPELLQSAQFQVHDFFMPQPVREAAVFLLRVVLHDWPDDFSRKILLRLRDAATSETKLIIADFVLPLACSEDMDDSTVLEGIEGAKSMPFPVPLLPNLGKASANVYWMDLTMQVMFNSQERTLRELVALALSAGWKVTKVTRTPGSHFGYLVAVPVAIPAEPQPPISEEDNKEDKLMFSIKETDSFGDRSFEQERRYRGDMEMIERASSRCGTPTFGSSTRLSSVAEAMARFGGGIIRSKGMVRSYTTPTGGAAPLKPPVALKPALSISSDSAIKKKKPSPLSVPSLLSSPLPPSRKMSSASSSPRQENPVPELFVPSPQSQSRSPSQHPPTKIITRRLSLANLRPSSAQTAPPPPVPVIPSAFSAMRQPPPSPLLPMTMQTQLPIARRRSHAQLSQAAAQTQGLPFAPSLIPVPVRASGPVAAEPPSPNKLQPTTGAARLPGGTLGSPISGPSRQGTPGGSASGRRASNAPLPQVSLTKLTSRKRSGTVVGPLVSGAVSWGGGAALGGEGPAFRFDQDRRIGGQSRTPSTRPHSPEAAGGVNVLAAAAKIDRGEFIQPPLSP